MEKLCWGVEIAVAKLLLQLWPAPPCGVLPEYTRWGVVSWQVALVQTMTAVVTFAQPTILLHFCSHDLIVNHCRGMYLVAIQPACFMSQCVDFTLSTQSHGVRCIFSSSGNVKHLTLPTFLHYM